MGSGARIKRASWSKDRILFVGGTGRRYVYPSLPGHKGSRERYDAFVADAMAKERAAVAAWQRERTTKGQQGTREVDRYLSQAAAGQLGKGAPIAAYSEASFGRRTGRQHAPVSAMPPKKPSRDLWRSQVAPVRTRPEPGHEWAQARTASAPPRMRMEQYADGKMPRNPRALDPSTLEGAVAEFRHRNPGATTEAVDVFKYRTQRLLGEHEQVAKAARRGGSLYEAAQGAIREKQKELDERIEVRAQREAMEIVADDISQQIPGVSLLPDHVRRPLARAVVGVVNPFGTTEMFLGLRDDPANTVEGIKRGFTDVFDPNATPEERWESGFNWASMLYPGAKKGPRTSGPRRTGPHVLSPDLPARTVALGDEAANALTPSLGDTRQVTGSGAGARGSIHRLDPRTAEEVARLARRTGRTMEEVVEWAKAKRLNGEALALINQGRHPELDLRATKAGKTPRSSRQPSSSKARREGHLSRAIADAEPHSARTELINPKPPIESDGPGWQQMMETANRERNAGNMDRHSHDDVITFLQSIPPEVVADLHLGFYPQITEVNANGTARSVKAHHVPRKEHSQENYPDTWREGKKAEAWIEISRNLTQTLRKASPRGGDLVRTLAEEIGHHLQYFMPRSEYAKLSKQYEREAWGSKAYRNKDFREWWAHKFVDMAQDSIAWERARNRPVIMRLWVITRKLLRGMYLFAKRRGMRDHAAALYKEILEFKHPSWMDEAPIADRE